MSAYAGASETFTVYVPTGSRTAGAALSSPTAHPRSIPQTEPSVNGLVPQNCGYRGVSGPEPSTRWRFQSFGQKLLVRDAMTPCEALETVKLTNPAIPSQPCATVAGSARRWPPMTSVTPIGLRYPGRATLSWKSPPIDARYAPTPSCTGPRPNFSIVTCDERGEQAQVRRLGRRGGGGSRRNEADDGERRERRGLSGGVACGSPGLVDDPLFDTDHATEVRPALPMAGFPLPKPH